MKRSTAVLAAVLAILATSAIAEQSWIRVAGNKETTFEVRAGSFELTKNRAGEPIASFMLRAKARTGSGNIDFEQDYVRISDCEAGYGQVVTTDLSGRFRYSTDFVFDGGNVASRIAQTLCDLAEASPEAEIAPAGSAVPAGSVRY